MPPQVDNAACDHGLEEPGQRPESPEQGERASGMATGSVISQPGSGSSNPSAAYLTETLDEIAANQRAFEQTRSLRKQYRLCLANEPLFARIGVVHPPMVMQQPPRGIGQRIVWWWLNR